MYEMCAGPAATGRDGLVWHVMAKDDVRTTLCGRHLAEDVLLRPIFPDAPTDRHCSPCMAASRASLQTAARERAWNTTHDLGLVRPTGPRSRLSGP